MATHACAVAAGEVEPDIDAGAIFDVARFGGMAIDGGLTWNIGWARGRPAGPGVSELPPQAPGR